MIFLLLLLLLSRVLGQNCIALSSAGVCPDLSEYSVLSTPDFNSSSSLNSYVSGLQSASNASYVTMFISTFDCPGYSASMDRYHSSLTSVSLPYCPSPTHVANVVLCQDVCNSYLGALKASFDDPTVCNANPDPTVSALRSQVLARNSSGFADYCASLPTSACSKGLALDQANCGFINASVRATYCSSGTNDTCCSVAPVVADPGLPPFPLGPLSDWPWIYALIGAGILVFFFPAFIIIDKVFIRSQPVEKAYMQRQEPKERKNNSATASFIAVDNAPGTVAINVFKHKDALAKPQRSLSIVTAMTGRMKIGSNTPPEISPIYLRSLEGKGYLSESRLDSGESSLDSRKEYAQSFATLASGYDESMRRPSAAGKRTSSVFMNGTSVLTQPRRVRVVSHHSPESGTAGQVSYRVVVVAYQSNQDDEFDLEVGDRIGVVDVFDDGWAIGERHGVTGMFALALTRPA